MRGLGDRPRQAEAHESSAPRPGPSSTASTPAATGTRGRAGPRGARCNCPRRNARNSRPRRRRPCAERSRSRVEVEAASPSRRMARALGAWISSVCAQAARRGRRPLESVSRSSLELRDLGLEARRCARRVHRTHDPRDVVARALVVEVRGRARRRRSPRERRELRVEASRRLRRVRARQARRACRRRRGRHAHCVLTARDTAAVPPFMTLRTWTT